MYRNNNLKNVVSQQILHLYYKDQLVNNHVVHIVTIVLEDVKKLFVLTMFYLFCLLKILIVQFEDYTPLI